LAEFTTSADDDLANMAICSSAFKNDGNLGDIMTTTGTILELEL
jgi:hypothetical protein